MQVATNWITLSGLAALLLSCSPEPRRMMKISTVDMASAISSETWQDVATNVQDWDRAAKKIANGLQYNGMLPGGLSRSTTGSPLFLKIQEESTFLRQLKGALETEITSRGGVVSNSAIGASTIDLTVEVVQWGSRLGSSDPRCEAVWQATLLSGSRIMLSFREPFYISAYDLPLYEIYQKVPTPDEALAGTARSLRYSTQ